MKVFISHSSNDKKFTRLLKSCLEENDIETWFDEDELDLGDSLLKKLESALDDSSHFVIVLSKASVNSDWVKLELKHALSNHANGFVQKIVPIKYRECEIPTELKDLIYADLTSEVVLPDGDKLKFISNGFDAFFLRLVRVLKNPLNSLSEKEKTKIKNLIKEKDNPKTSPPVLNNMRGTYQLDGLTEPQDEAFSQRIIDAKPDLKKELIRPILLPASIQTKWDLKIGDEIEIIGPNFKSKSIAHFAEFRVDDLKIVAHVNTRSQSKIYYNNYYNVEFDPASKKILFISEVQTESE